MEFKDYKEKQKYYRERVKQTKLFWNSIGTINKGTKEKPRWNGRTYIKPKENNDDNDPSSIAYFTLGFITCFILIIMLAIYLIHKEESKKQDIMKSYMEIFAKLDSEEKDNKE